MAYTFYHRTTEEAARAILSGGFRDGRERYGLTGVFVSDYPLSTGEGAKGDAALFEIVLDLADEDLAWYELIEFQKPYREWVIPAALLNARGRVRRVSEDEEFARFPCVPSPHTTVRGPSGREYAVFRKNGGPTVVPYHVPGRWYWSPLWLVSEDVDAPDDPPYALSYESREQAERAALLWDVGARADR